MREQFRKCIFVRPVLEMYFFERVVLKRFFKRAILKMYFLKEQF